MALLFQGGEVGVAETEQEDKVLVAVLLQGLLQQGHRLGEEVDGLEVLEEELVEHGEVEEREGLVGRGLRKELVVFETLEEENEGLLVPAGGSAEDGLAVEEQHTETPLAGGVGGQFQEG